MKRFLAVLLLPIAFPAAAQTVEAAEGTWRHLPVAKERGVATISPLAITRIHEVIASGECQVPGQSARKLDMTVSFALQFDAQGTLQRVIIPKIGCPEIEGILGGTVLELTRDGRYSPTGESAQGWYRSDITFTSYDPLARSGRTG